MKTLIFHGPSGSGKDTQLDLLAQKYDFERIGGSTVKNSLLEEGHPLALEAQEYGRQGKLYPDEIMYGMLDIWLSRLDSTKKWFFVSPVRKDTQIQLFDNLVSKYERQLDLFVHFTLSEADAIERMSLRTSCPVCNTTYHSKFKPEKVSGICDNDNSTLIHREDDNPDAISKRLAWYNDDLKPILAEYSSRGKLLEIDAAPSIPEIQEKLLQELDKYVS